MYSYVDEGSLPEKEAQAVQIIQEVFPNRALVLLDAMTVNYNGGGIHCATQQEPSVKK